jgi:hypothetical protein
LPGNEYLILLNSPYLFLTEPFLQQQGDFRLISASSGNSSVVFPFFVQNGRILSPVKGPFGSFLFDSKPNNKLVLEILVQLESLARKEKVHTIQVIFPPDCYQPEVNVWLQPLMISEGYQIAWQDLNFHRELTNSFETGLHRSERWKLRKSLQLGYDFRMIPEPDWDFAYPFFLESRRRKGYLLSMEREDLEKTFRLFPDAYRMSGVFFQDQCVALALSIQVNEEIEYVFYTADQVMHRKLSPVVLLHYGLANDCMEKGVKLLDLGTSSLKGVVNSGVATFKRNLGATASLKSTFQRKFS